MTTLAKANLITREAVGKLEHRFGRKGLYVGGAFLLVVLFLVFRNFGPKGEPPRTTGRAAGSDGKGNYEGRPPLFGRDRHHQRL